MATTELDDQLDRLEWAIDESFNTGRVDRRQITQMAQLDAAEAVACVGEAMEADEEADEATRIAIIAERGGQREQIRSARTREREARKRANSLHDAATKSAKNAYDAIRFSAPNRMGLMRVVQVLFGLHIVISIVGLLMTHRDNYEYGLNTMMSWAMIIFEGIAFWMFMNRYKIARPFVIAVAAVRVVVPALVQLATGTFRLPTFIADAAYSLMLICYFVFSSRVKATLVNDISKHTGVYDKEELVIERRGWPFVRNLGIYFVVFSILGHWMEMGMCQLIILKLVEGDYDPSNTMLWRDWLYPFPMEGMAVVLIALLLYPLLMWLKRRFENRIIPYVISFLANALTCSIIEFTMGLIYNPNYELWDYRQNFGNIMGQVCLQNALAFGVACSIIAWFVYPMLERWISRVPRDVMNIVFVAVMVFGGIIFSLYIVEPPAYLTETVQQAATSVEEAENRDLASVEGSANKDLRESVRDSDKLSDEKKTELLDKIDEADREIADVQRQLDEAA